MHMFGSICICVVVYDFVYVCVRVCSLVAEAYRLCAQRFPNPVF